MKRIIFVGVTSAIGEQIARNLLAEGSAFFLTGRVYARACATSADLWVRDAAMAQVVRFDLADAVDMQGFLTSAANSLGGLDAVILVAGQLPDQDEVNRDSQCLRETMAINATSAMVLLNEAATFFEQQGHGQIVAIGSVAGDRGRATNYAYGAAKGALEIFLSGLRHRLHKSGVQVLLVKPGFVDTPMTAAFKNGSLWASPKRVARDIVRAMDKGKSVIYTPLVVALVAALAVIAYLGLAVLSDASTKRDGLQRLGPGQWLTLLGLSLLNYALRFLRWHGYLRALGAGVGLGRDLLIYVADFAFTVTPGKAGEAVR